MISGCNGYFVETGLLLVYHLMDLVVPIVVSLYVNPILLTPFLCAYAAALAVCNTLRPQVNHFRVISSCRQCFHLHLQSLVSAY